MDSSSVAHDAICVVGIGCRYPGEKASTDGLWKVIVEARSTHSEVPKERWDPDIHYHPDHERMGSMNTRGGYFLRQDISHFDAPFFSITANEASGMDPQQRLLLETTYETIENAGMTLAQLRGSKTGLYVGSFCTDYSEETQRDMHNLHPYSSTGYGRSMLANRVSWFYDLRGPSFTIDTACSSSMYALHLACQSLRLGETDIGIVGGSNVIISPAVMCGLTSMRFLSPTGKCHSYDQSADGYARGEGVGMVMLKRLSDAIADGDTIRAIVRSTGVNQDGRTPGITMPSQAAQAALIRQCYQDAGICMDETTYFEGHGTGTLLGDPIELQALSATFGATRDMENSLYVGSVKANIGHQEGGAGVAGLIRAILAVEKGIIPPTAELEKPNSAFKLEQWKIALPSVAIRWPNSDVRRASVNSFGYGGANSHVIIEDAHHYMQQHGLRGNHCTQIDARLELQDQDDSGWESGPSTPALREMPPEIEERKCLVAFSAFDQAALARNLARYLDFLQEQGELCDKQKSAQTDMLSDLAFTLATRRTVFDHRVAFVAGSLEELLVRIRSLPAPQSKKVPRKENTVFVFTGQGAQYFLMGKGLLIYKAFRESLEQSQAFLADLGCEWNIVEELLRGEDETQINRPRFAQPICTALQIAQVQLLASWGIHPKATIGHSSGEISAAFSSAMITHKDAMCIAYHRGLFSDCVNDRQSSKQGAMLAVALSPEEVETDIAKINAAASTKRAIVVACINSPKSVTISGDSRAIEILEQQLIKKNVFARRLKTSDTAYHSPHMDLIAEDYLDSIAHVAPLSSGGSVPMFSSVTGKLIANASDLDARYWVDNMLQPVNFLDAMRSMLQHSNNPRKRHRLGCEYTALVELGPSSTLKGPIQQILAAEDAKRVSHMVYTSVLRRGEEADVCALRAAAVLWAQGTPVDFGAINEHLYSKRIPKVAVNLPTYAWNHSSRMWHDTTANRLWMREPRTDLLGLVSGFRNMNSPVWRNAICMSETPWLADHKIFSSAIFPGTSMIVMALEAAQKQAERGRVVKGYQFRDVSLPRALPIPPDNARVEVLMYIKPHRLGTRTQDSSWYEFSLVSLDDKDQWNEHCFGQYKIIYATEASEVDGGLQSATDWATKRAQYEEAKQRMYQEVPRKAFYKSLHGIGMNYGPTFQGVEKLFIGDRGDCHAVVGIPDTASVMPHNFEHPHLIHPATLDAITQMLFGASIKNSRLKSEGAQMPVNIGKLYIAADLPSGAGSRFSGYAVTHKRNTREMVGQIVMSDDDWSEPKVVYEDFVTVSMNSAMTGQAQGVSSRKKCATVQWVQDLRYGPPIMSATTTPAQGPDNSMGEQWSDEVVDLMLRTLDELRDQRLPTEHLKQYFEWADAACADLRRVSLPTDAEVSEVLDEFPERLGATLASGRDLSAILDDELFTDVAISMGDSATTADYAALDTWLESIYLNNPNASILLLGDGSPSSAACYVARTHIARIGMPDRLHQCILSEADDMTLKRTKATLESERLQVSYSAFNPGKDAKLSGMDSQTLDLVVAPPSIAMTEVALTNIRSVMSATGILLLSGYQQLFNPYNFISALSETWWEANMGSLTSGIIDADSIQWQQRIRAAGIDAAFHTDERNGVLTLAVMMQEPTEMLLHHRLGGRHIVFIQPRDTASPAAVKFQELLTELLLQANCTVGTAALGEKDALNGQTVICLAELSEDLLANMNETTFAALKDTVACASQLVWLTRGCVHLDSDIDQKHDQDRENDGEARLNLNQALTTGLLRSIRSEVARTVNVHLDLSSNSDIASCGTAQLVLRVIANELSPEQSGEQGNTKDETHDRELALHGNKVFVPRVTWNDSFNQELAIPHRQEVATKEPLYQEDRALQLIVGTVGRLDSMQWVDSQVMLDKMTHPAYIQGLWCEIKVKAWSLNFMDIMAAMGQIPTRTLGLEIAGEVVRCGPACTRIKPGMRVYLPSNPSFVTKTYCWEKDCVEVPADMDLATAASLPVAYMTAYVGLVRQGRLAKGESILIHAAAGGVGQATLQMARWIGAEIYVTVGSNAKKQLLIDHYGIPEERIFSSRDLSFVTGIMRATAGRGVDVVVNSLSGEALRETWNCIAFSGRFIEIGKRDMLGNTGLEMSPFLRQVTFTSVNLEAYERVDPDGFRRMWTEVCALIARGVVGPIHPVTKIGVNDVEKAFRLMASGAHMGKVVVVAETLAPCDDLSGDNESYEYIDGSDDDILVPVMPRKLQEVELESSATYILCGGLGGIGRSTALMMANHGAKHLVFLSRSGASKTEHVNLLKDLEAAGVRTDVIIYDAASASAVASFAEICKQNEWKVKGVIQCAMVLRDRMFENMTHQDWTEATEAKVRGTKNLSDFLPVDMDFFIMLSSLSGVIGNPGQANYSAANTYMDALAQWRRSQGMAAIAIDLGVVADVGYLAENDDALDAYAAMAPLHITELELWTLLSAAMKGRTADDHPVPAQVVAGFGKEFLASGAWSKDNKFSHTLGSSASLENNNSEFDALRQAMMSAPSIRDAARDVQEALVSRLGRGIMLEASDIDVSKPLHAYGVDSLVAVEIRNWTFRELSADMTIFDIMSPMPIYLLSLKIASVSALLSKAVIAESIEEVTNEMNAATNTATDADAKVADG